MTPELAAAVKDAEQRIERILAELEEDTNRKIDCIEVDTRNYAQLYTKIYLVEP